MVNTCSCAIVPSGELGGRDHQFSESLKHSYFCSVQECKYMFFPETCIDKMEIIFKNTLNRLLLRFVFS